jgi:cytochrome c oxidase cbb3-type subunit 1
MAVNPKKLRPYDEPPRKRFRLIPTAPDSAAGAFLVVSLLWLVVATGIGAIGAFMLTMPDTLRYAFEYQFPVIGTVQFEISATTVNAGFMDALVYGWLSNVAFAAILFILPRITGTAMRMEGIAWGAMWIWNLGVAGGMAAVYFPTYSGTGMLAEFPTAFDGLLLLGLLMVNGAFWLTLMAAPRRLPYISLWFFGLALLVFMGAYALGAAVQAGDWLIDLDDTLVALVNAFVARLILTFWVIGVALGSLFYVVPRSTFNALAYGGMAFASWVLWAGLSGVSALGALVDPSIPYFVTSLGNAGTILLLAPIFLAVASLALTFRGRWSLSLGAGALAFALLSMTFLLSTAVLEAIGAIGSVQTLVRGTEWALGPIILATLGAATFAHFAFIDHAAPRLLRRDWVDNILTDVQMWASFVGAATAGLALVGAGIVHGSLMADGADPGVVNGTLTWFRYAASAGLALASLGGLAALVSLFMMYTTARRAEYSLVDAVPADGAPADGAPADAVAAAGT